MEPRIDVYPGLHSFVGHNILESSLDDEDILAYLGDRFELLAHVLVQALVRKRCLLNQTTMQLR